MTFLRFLVSAFLCFSASSFGRAATTHWDLTLTWSTATKHSAYELQRSDDVGAFATIATPAATDTSFVDRMIPAGATVRYRLRATQGDKFGPWTPEAAITLPKPAEPPPDPTQPGELVITISPSEPPAATPPPPASTLRIEAEGAQRTGKAAIVSDPAASGGTYVHLAERGDSVVFAVSVPVAGDYHLRARVLSPNQQSDSMFITVGGGEVFAWNHSHGPNWAEHTVTRAAAAPVVLQGAGPHTITLAHRETARIDWIEIVPIP